LKDTAIFIVEMTRSQGRTRHSHSLVGLAISAYNRPGALIHNSQHREHDSHHRDAAGIAPMNQPMLGIPWIFSRRRRI